MKKPVVCLATLVVAGALWITARAATSADLKVGIISTVAGSGLSDFGGDGGAATAAQMDHPQGVALDSAGNIYVADAWNNRIRKVTAGTGLIATIAGSGVRGFGGDGGLATSAQFDRPAGLAVDGAGNVFVADTNNHRVRKITVATGIITTVAGDPSSSCVCDGSPATTAFLMYPTGVAVGFGSFFIADTQRDRIRKVDGLGIITTIAGTGTPGYNGDGLATTTRLNHPSGIALDAIGNLYFSDDGNHRIRKLTISTGLISTVAGSTATDYAGEAAEATSAGLSTPRAIALDSAGNFYFADDNRIRRVSATTNVITTVAGSFNSGPYGDGGAAPAALLNQPFGVAVDSGGNIYIADEFNHRVRKVTPPAIPSLLPITVAGTGIAGFSGDGGLATQAQIFGPMGVAVDAVGNVYFAAMENHRIRRVNAATGIITTVAGTGVKGYSGDNGAATSADVGLPRGIALDAAGNIYFSDYHSQTVRKVAAATGIITTIASGLSNPLGVAVDGSGNVFVCDGGVRVKKIAAGTGVVTTVAGNGTAGTIGDGGLATSAQLNAYAIAIDTTGNLYIAGGDPGTGTSGLVRKVTVATGVISRIAGTVATDDLRGENSLATGAVLNFGSTMGFPDGSLGGVAVDAAGNVYIADTGHNRIRKVTKATGILTTVVGNGAAGFAGDGVIALTGSVFRPAAVAVDAAGNLYIADTWNHRIQKAQVPVDPPTSLVAAAFGPHAIRLAWVAPPNATSFNIKRSTTAGAEVLLASGVTGTSYTDSTVTPSVRYYYVVSANFVNIEGPASNEASFILTVAPGDVNGDGFADLIWRNSSNGSNVVWNLNGLTFSSQSNFPVVTDPAWQLVASADINDDSHLDLIWRNSMTGANVVWYMNGTTLLDQASFPTVADPAWQLVASADTNQDGRADLIWRNLMTGANVVWYMNGTTLVSQGNFPSMPDLAWQLAASTDFNLDGWPDLVWHNRQTGDTVVWYLIDTAYQSEASFTTVADPAWVVVGALDVNADGWPDLLWRNSTTGLNLVWTLNGTTVVTQERFPDVVDQTWRMIGATLPDVPVDINLDRHPDLVWRNASTGENVVWYWNGASITGQVPLPLFADLSWQLVAKADVNNDAYVDLIWRNSTTGANVVWYMNGAVKIGEAALATVSDSAWKLVASADVNGDHHPDLIWRNATTGSNLVWQMNGVTVLAQMSLPPVPDLNWKIADAADVDGDTHPDLIWRNNSTGANVVWYLNGTTLIAQANLPSVTDTTWQVAAAIDMNSDGHPDLVWRNSSSGANVVWYLNGTAFLGQIALPAVSDLSWTLRPGG